MRKGEANLPVATVSGDWNRRQESIVAKCHPAIFELANLLKESIEALNQLGENPPGELTEKITVNLDRRTAEIHKKYSGTVPPAPNTFAAQIILSDAALRADSDGQCIAEWIHFQRHKIPAKVDAEKQERKDWDASRRILRTTSDLEQLRCGKGPIPAFKGNLDHWTMFEALWGFGIEHLTPDELADFFDDFCPCDCDHDPDALKKLRARFQKAIA